MSAPGDPHWRDQPQQYQVDPMTGQPVPYGGYQGFGLYQQQPPPPPRKPDRTPWIVAAAAVVVVAVGVVTTLLLVDSRSDPGTPIAATTSTPPPPSSSSSSTKRPSPRPTTSKTPTEVKDILVEPVVEGWQGVLSPKEGVAYDVPPDWKVQTPGTIVGFEDNDGKPAAVMHGVSTYKDGACPGARGSYRGHVGFATADELALDVAARGGVKLFAESAALNPDGSKAPVVVNEIAPRKVGQGKVDAVTATAVLTVTQPGECPSPSVLFTSVAFKVGTRTALFVMYMDQGVPDALPAEVAEKVIASLRPHSE